MRDNQDYYIQGKFIKRGHFQQTLLKNDVTRYVAYFLQSLFVFSLLFINKILKRNTKEYKYNVCLCGIFKNEGNYLDEWIQYHLVAGIDHFYLYNNNSDDNYLEILQPYIEIGVVDLVEWPFNHSQMTAYNDCYDKHRNDTQWLTFIDVDEFICPIATDNIKSWLQSYENYPGVAVYWKQFGSNGQLIHDNDKLVIEQYTQCWSKPSVFTKMFCNMDFIISDFNNMHTIKSQVLGLSIPPVNQYKRLISFGVNLIPIFNYKDKIQINHYWGKAYDTFQEKLNRSDAYYEDSDDRKQIRERLLRSHEVMCTERDFTIQRFLLYTKLRNYGNK
jgi:hypothetical protein